MPNPFAGVMVRLKMETARRMVRTCFTFAMGRQVRRDREGRRRRTGDGDAERPNLGVCGEADDVQSKGHGTIDQQCGSFVGIHLAGTVGVDAF